MKKIGLLMISLVLFAQAEFSRGDSDLTVIDSETKLEWQDSYSKNKIFSDYWNNSVAYCQNLVLDSHDDWRLPNINELKTIVVETQYAPAIATGDDKFKYTRNSRYWSSTTSRYHRDLSWIINFSNGVIGVSNSTNSTSTNYSYVRCVRN